MSAWRIRSSGLGDELLDGAEPEGQRQADERRAGQPHGLDGGDERAGGGAEHADVVPGRDAAGLQRRRGRLARPRGGAPRGPTSGSPPAAEPTNVRAADDPAERSRRDRTVVTSDSDPGV